MQDNRTVNSKLTSRKCPIAHKAAKKIHQRGVEGSLSQNDHGMTELPVTTMNQHVQEHGTLKHVFKTQIQT